MMALANAQFAACASGSQGGAGLLESVAGLQRSFAAFFFVETLLVPLEQWLADRIRPRLLLALGGALSAASLLAAGLAPSGRAAVLRAALGGVGAALFYAGSVTRALERFPDGWRRPVAALALSTALGALTAWPIVAVAKLPYAPALLPWSAAQAALMVVAALFLFKPPPPGWEPPAGA